MAVQMTFSQSTEGTRTECDPFGIRWIGIPRPPSLEFRAPNGDLVCRAHPVFLEDPTAKVRVPEFSNIYRMSSQGGLLNGCVGINSMAFSDNESFLNAAQSLYAGYEAAGVEGRFEYLRSLGFKA